VPVHTWKESFYDSLAADVYIIFLFFLFYFILALAANYHFVRYGGGF
jgi:hypothetical protein